ncbi:uncharacterized protein A4U43_C07F7560 [Asparagus officinalis]|uniref:Cyclin N-terminal domain-containing protein n=1 Tax=Asparagus officinalis TaxID=4686 RepID=A0A5P1EAF5_ASPOF|nr:uncharacterized protein A4U43_C07F7560 [Asparagus officinalis]
MLELMDGFLKSDQVSLQKDILDHVEYTVSRWGVSFDDFEAYQVLKMEIQALNLLSFHISVPTVKTFLRRYIRAAHTSYKVGFPPSPESSGQLRSRANIG